VWAKAGAAVLAVALAVGGVWLAGGFAERTWNRIDLAVGEPVDVGPLVFTPLRAMATLDGEGPGVVVRVEAMCQNMTDAPLSSWDVTNVMIRGADPVTRQFADNHDLVFADWTEAPENWWRRAVGLDINPLRRAQECTYFMQFASGLGEGDTIPLVLQPIAFDEGRFESTQLGAYTGVEGDVYRYDIPLVREY
jgi:hypothetical protein